MASVSQSFSKAAAARKAKRPQEQPETEQRPQEQSETEPPADPPMSKEEEIKLKSEYVRSMGPIPIERMCNLIFVPHYATIHDQMETIAERVTDEDWGIANELGVFYHLV